jgi:hypothetical protein
MCQYDGNVLVPVEVCDVEGNWNATSWQCPLCERLYSRGMEMETAALTIVPLQAGIVE